MKKKGLSGSWCSSHTMRNAYFIGTLTKIKMVLPAGKKNAWELISTPTGITSWLLEGCSGHFQPRNDLVFTWPGGTQERVHVVYMGEKHSSLQLQRQNQSRLRFYLHGRMTTLTLEIDYRLCKRWKQLQSSELGIWAFSLANLKSIALGGPNLLNKMPGRTRMKGFVD